MNVITWTKGKVSQAISKRGKKEDGDDGAKIPSYDLTPSAPPDDGYQYRTINVEAEVDVSVCLDKFETRMEAIVAPLINLHMDYKGEGRYKNIWLPLVMVAVFGLKLGQRSRDNTVYKVQFGKGLKLKIKSRRPFEMDRKISWNQFQKYLCNGLTSEWSIRCQLEYTLVDYSMKHVDKELLQYLRAMRVRFEVDENQNLVLIMDY
ncbi:putative matrix protein [Zahedan rhabdovirus]|uniref:Putative matrix protein n=1 Tax=Zahedan rhabdovirus TaxID=1620507 RepID=A0A0R6CHI1_9RHAB|nr:putative matrix protein [Zahedan rhabdovirus]AJR16766.1 putative matrix protein [Zahedan rhabdovirus]